MITLPIRCLFVVVAKTTLLECYCDDSMEVKTFTLTNENVLGVLLSYLYPNFFPFHGQDEVYSSGSVIN